MDLYNKIKILASKHEISIRSLEEKLGFGNGTIRRWQTQTPGIDKVLKVADYFDVSIDYLLGRNQVNSSRLTNPDAELLATHLNKTFTDNDMAKIIDYIDLIKKSKR